MRQLRISKQVTEREDWSLDKYLKEIAKIPLINADQENELARRIKLWDQQALQELTKANLRFVVSVAKQYKENNVPLIDLINEGNLGLIKAAQRFDETRGFKFISHAVWWIRQSILKFLQDNWKTVRLPLNKIWQANKINKVYDELLQTLQREPTSLEIQERLTRYNINLKTHEIVDINNKYKWSLSIDTPITEGSDKTFSEWIQSHTASPDNNLYIDSLQTEIERALDTLKPRESQIIRLYFGLDNQSAKTLNEIAELFDLKSERVRQIKEKAIKRLKETSKNQILKTYLW